MKLGAVASPSEGDAWSFRGDYRRWSRELLIWGALKEMTLKPGAFGGALEEMCIAIVFVRTALRLRHRRGTALSGTLHECSLWIADLAAHVLS